MLLNLSLYMILSVAVLDVAIQICPSLLELMSYPVKWGVPLYFHLGFLFSSLLNLSISSIYIENHIRCENFCFDHQILFKKQKKLDRQGLNSPSIQGLNFQNIQKTNKNPNNPIKKWAKDLNRHFSKEDIQTVTGTWEDA